MIGMLRIVELRDKARAALGPQFSLPAFRDRVLQSGSVPQGGLGDPVDAWTVRQARA